MDKRLVSYTAIFGINDKEAGDGPFFKTKVVQIVGQRVKYDM